MKTPVSSDCRPRPVQRANAPVGRRRLAALAALLLITASMPIWGQESVPTRHFIVPNPAELTDADAEEIYQRISDKLVRGYQLSNHPAARSYQRWRRFDRAPYRSGPHGERFVNHYANGIGHDAYGALKEGERMPVGSLIAKDSFAVTKAGEVYSGPLFLMEKMPEGFDPAGHDWRYTMIMPDGSVFGVTKGPDSQKVEFCQKCHQIADEGNDHLFFVPERYRIPPAE